jgi:hypothetical protein
MHTNRDSSSANDTELLACRDGSFALSKRWSGHAQAALDGNKAIVLHQDFKATWTLLLDTDQLAGRCRHNRGAGRCR